MSSIRILPEDVSNRIAAGEVIERPASVLKELMENSIDAGATVISAAVERAGKKLISVSDDGAGMSSDDARLCFEPHATSKISALEDMDSISTMGFRGEALPSIASVSRVRMRTRLPGVTEGTEVVIEGGRVIFSGPVGCAAGTEFAVRDIFFNTPARKKFLKGDPTEEKHLTDMFCQIALGHPHISFDLTIDGVKAISSPAGKSLVPRIQLFLGRQMKDSLLPLKFEKSGILIEGYIAKHGVARKYRREQRIYINRRPVESPAVYAGLKNGYESTVMRGLFPPALLFIGMSPDRVDFNVHPAKREVRFREPALVSNLVAEAVRGTLRKSVRPLVSLPSKLPLDTILSGARVDYSPPEQTQQSLPGIPSPEDPRLPPPSFLPEITPEIDLPAPWEPLSHRESLSPSEDLPQEPVVPYGDIKILAFLDSSYILASAESGLLIIDQHAAHERILFEQILGGPESVSLSQKLLLPITLELPKSEIRFIEKNADIFSELGFDLESFGSNTVIIRSVPPVLPSEDNAKLFSEIIAGILEDENFVRKPDKAGIARIACTRAVKAHDRLSAKEAESLLKQLHKCKLPYSCPHGRPTIISISYKELERRFGRK
ncbi:MAG: DNA mismatch repair endonuclease MutL [Victivallales bacterium]|nr:DNA mismatch repair endonuclease MutL [Victivallales bacterium]